MGTQETRQSQRGSLYQMLVSKATGNIDDAILHQQATMEPEDIELVKSQFAAWEKLHGKEQG